MDWIGNELAVFNCTPLNSKQCEVATYLFQQSMRLVSDVLLIDIRNGEKKRDITIFLLRIKAPLKSPADTVRRRMAYTLLLYWQLPGTEVLDLYMMMV